MDDLKYDEFGNYIGPELKDSSDEEESEEEEEESEEEEEERYAGGSGENGYGEDVGGQLVAAMDLEEQALVLHEDKKYYPEVRCLSMSREAW